MLRKLFFEFQYRFSKPPWDSGITPPEVVAQIESGTIKGRALDLGCGTGTNSIYLAQHGLTVVGVDFSPKAIATARDKARRANANIDFHVADVTRLDSLGVNEPFDFVLDIGCLHSVDEEGRARYASNLARLTRAGSLYMLYAFSPRPPSESGRLAQIRNVGVTQERIQQLFAPVFALEHVERGADHGERVSAWYWLRRQ
jgi:cyclopropane fatty-acyl-phospholipid synthase-like methyltransferase